MKSQIPMRELFLVIFMEYFRFLRGRDILCEIELNNVESQIEKRKLGGKWDICQSLNPNI